MWNYSKTANDPYLTPRVDTKHVRPPPGLFPAGAFDEGDPLRSRDGQAERMPGDAVGLAHLQDCRHVDTGLRDCVWLWTEREKWLGGCYGREKSIWCHALNYFNISIMCVILY